MLNFDITRGVFLIDGGEIELSPERLNKLKAIKWTQSIQITSNYKTSGRIDTSILIDKHRLNKTEWTGKRVLVIGCYEGFEAFYIEAQGAAEVVLLRDDFYIIPSPLDGQIFLKELFNSNVKLLDKKAVQLSRAEDGEFDLILFCDALVHLPDTFETFRKISEMSRDEFIISTPFFLSNDQFPLCVLFDRYGTDNEPRDVSGPTRAWIYCAIDQLNFHIVQSTIWETDHLVAYLKRRDKPRKEIKPKTLNELPTDQGMESKTAILLITCQKYQQAWLPFFTFLQRYWPDCPYKIYLATDFGTYPGVHSLNSGETGSAQAWTKTLMAALAAIPEERVIFFQEDFLILTKVDNLKISRLVRHAYDYNAACIRLMPVPPPTSKWHACRDLGTIGPFDSFRFSMQCSIWHRTILLSLLSEIEDPWTCEFAASRRSQLVQWPFLGTWETAINYYCTAIIQGEWQDDALTIMKNEGIPMDRITKRI